MDPIVWTEGAFLSQQHFQYWETWLLEQNNLYVRTLMPHAYGLVACELETETFKRNVCSIKKLVWRDERGSWFSHQGETGQTLAAPLDDRDEILIYLVLPKNKLCSGLSGYKGIGDQAAFAAEYREVSDQYDQERVHELCVGIPRGRISSHPADPQHYDSWPILKLNRLASAQFTVDHSFMPVSMVIKASEAILVNVDKLQKQLMVKAQELISHLKQVNEPEIQYEYSLVTEALFNLKMMLTQGSATPRELYELLAHLCIRLGVRQGKYLYPEAYQHASMGNLLSKVMEELIALLCVELESLPRYTLEIKGRTSPSVSDLDSEHLQGHEWYLSIDFSNLPADSVTKFLSQAKLGTVSTLDYMIASALPGINLTHQSRLPKAIRLEEGHEYFKLDTQGADWNLVKEERSLMLYRPGFLEGRTLSLILVKD